MDDLIMDKTSKIYVAGHRGLVGSAIWNNLLSRGYTNLVGRTHKELDLTDQYAVKAFFDEEKRLMFPISLIMIAAVLFLIPGIEVITLSFFSK